MQHTFQLSCESTVDLPYSYVEKRDVAVLFYSYTVNAQEYPDDMGRDPQALRSFYQRLKEGALPSTSQINVYTYCDYFEELLKKGDVLHIAFGSGMTPSVTNALKAAETLRPRYPERKLIVLDSFCSSSGYGLMVDEAADMRDRGCSMEEIEAWVQAHCKTIHHQFFSSNMQHFRRSGRVSGATAAVATVLGICPLMRLNEEGRIIAYSKARGKKNAILETVRCMEESADGGKDYNGKCFIAHSDCIEDAEYTRQLIRERFPHCTDVRIYDIGTIIASHCGPGTVAVFFHGCKRPK